MSSETEMQHVWRTMSSVSNVGYVVWDIMELMGEPFRESYFIKCSDNSYISIQCFHFWTEEKAVEFLNQCAYDEYQTVEIVGMK